MFSLIFNEILFGLLKKKTYYELKVVIPIWKVLLTYSSTHSLLSVYSLKVIILFFLKMKPSYKIIGFFPEKKKNNDKEKAGEIFLL